MSPWRPGQYAEKLKLEQPYEDIPDHLKPLLRAWCAELLASQSGLLTRVLLALRVSMKGHRPLETLVGAMDESDELMLTVIEIMLPEIEDYRHVRRLEEVLAVGNSAYKVSEDYQRLEMRVMPEVVAATQAVVDAAGRTGSAGEHLAVAWTAAYGRKPDPVKAYSEAIKAVEAAAAPVLTPNDLKATLGTLRGHLKAHLAQYQLAVDNGGTQGAQVLLDVMSLLWDNQTSRHGGVQPTVPETPEAGRAAVDLAVMLVQWFVSGAVQKR